MPSTAKGEPHAMRALRYYVFTALLLLPLISLAVPTGLNIMPTADVLGSGQGRMEYESPGGGLLYIPQGGWIYGSQSGLFLGIEGGLDDVNGTTVYNLKWRLLSEGFVLPSFAIGAQNISHDLATQYYAVMTKSLAGSLLKVSAGMLSDGAEPLAFVPELGSVAPGATYTMLGMQSSLGALTFKADEVNGGVLARSALSLGYTFHNFTLTGTLYHFKNAPDTRTLMLSYSSGLF